MGTSDPLFTFFCFPHGRPLDTSNFLLFGDFLDCEQLMVKLVTTLLTWKCPICRGMAPPPLDYDYNELIVRLISDCYLQIEEFQFTFT